MKDEERDVLASRRDKHATWLAAGGRYANHFRRTATAAELHERHAGDDKATLEQGGAHTAIAGRIMLRRVMGKASFITVQDGSGQIQCYLTATDLGESYQSFRDLTDIGDLVGVAGRLMRTNKGELTIHARELLVLNKTLRPLPDKYHGLSDQETRYRQRYLDLMVNGESRELFRTRSRIIHEIRTFFVERGFLEVETPMMHVIPGGAAARPFVTHHNALDLDLYLRIAPELFLKRLVVGGFEQVFEINRNFRNEGLSARHNPEFTMLEFYWAYHDYRDLIALTSELLERLALRVLGRTRFTWEGHELDFARAPACMTMVEAIVRFGEVSEADARDASRLRAVLRGWNVEVPQDASLAAIQVLAFETRVEERLIDPVFITGYPTEISPLSRTSDDDPEYADRFELFIGGREIANGFSELNDPVDQAARFRDQADRKARGDDEAMHYDHDYVVALEYGLPPTAGEGIGIDRLVMLLTDASSIRDVLLFPLMRPRDE